jgi:hypothetical protein
VHKQVTPSRFQWGKQGFQAVNSEVAFNVLRNILNNSVAHPAKAN